MNEKILKLKEGDYIAFGFNYNGGEPNEIIVTNITSIDDDELIVHFLYGHHSLSEIVKKEDVLAIGNSKGEDGIKGWSGKFDIINPTQLLLDNLKDK